MKLKVLDSIAHFFKVTKGTIVVILTVATIVTGVHRVTVINVVTIASLQTDV